MSRRLPSSVIKDILSCLNHLQDYTKSLSFNDFASNYMVVEACHIIGEAVAQLDDDVKNTEKQIPWTLIKGMRNKLIHEYFGTDLSIVWNVIKIELPEFRTQLENIHGKLVDSGR